MSRVLPTTCRPGVTAVEKVIGAGPRRPRDPLDHAPPSRIVRASVACVLVGSLVLACSGVTSLGSLPSEQAGAGDGGDGTATLERDGGPEVKAPTLDAISRLTLAICKNIYRCTHASDEEDALRVMFASPEDCAERIPSLWWPEHHLWGWIARLDKSVAPLVALGKVAVDEAALDGCVAAADQCLPGSEVGLGPCSKIFKGTTAEDAPCTSTEVCRSGLYCKRQTTGSCPGACAPQLPLGSPCTYAPDECQGDDFCTRYDPAPSSVCTATIRTA